MSKAIRGSFLIKTLLLILCLFLLTLNGLSAYPHLIKDVGTPAEEASSASRLRNARTAEDQGRRLREVGNKPPEAAHPVPKTPSAAAKSGEKEKTLSRSKKINVHHQGVTTPEAAAQQNAPKLPSGFKPQQHFNPPQRAVQPTPAPKPRVEQSSMRSQKADLEPRVRPINNRMPINAEYANKVYPLEKLPEPLRQKYPHSVPFTGTGHPDFSRYAIKKVEINVTGKNWLDFSAADKAAGLSKRPEGYTWHHHHDGKTMQLIPEELHTAVKHTGGVAKIKEKFSGK